MNTNTGQALPPQEAPHRCPWFVHYLLASPLRRIGEAPEKVVGPLIQPGMAILDVGCGFGFFSLPMAKLVGPKGRVFAVDVEPRCIAKLKKRAQKAGLSPRINARPCSTTSLELDELKGELDLITLIHTFHELEAQDAFLSEAMALLKPGGKLYILEPAGHVSQETFDLEVERTQKAGFIQKETPQRRKRFAALFTRP